VAIDPQLEKVVSSMAKAEAAIAAKGAKGGDRPWLDFHDISPTGKFNFAGLHGLFDRKVSNDAYAKLRENPNAVSKDIQTAKLSADFLAGTERDYRMRQRSRVRVFVHGLARAAVHGNAAGPLTKHSVGWLSRALTDDKGK
jgi:hypothetical protein